MKRLLINTLVLLAVFLHSSSCADGDGRCVPLFVRVGEKATIKCSITNPDQDGVYMYRQRDEKEESVLYYYIDGTFTVEMPYKGRLGINEDFGDFSVSINNVSEYDGGVYWCKFNKRDVYTFSERMCLILQSEICSEGSESNLFIYLGVIGGLSFIILLLVVILVRLCCERGNYTQKDHPSNGVYEVMRGNTTKALVNPAYESSQRRICSDLS